MKKLFTLVGCLPVLLFAQTTHNVAVFGGGTGNPLPQYDPQFLTIDVGDEVVWNNTQGRHNVYGELDIFPNNPEGFSSGVPAFAPWMFSFVFNIPGTYGYHCTQNDHALTQFGTITVVNPNGVNEATAFGKVKLFPVPAYNQLTVELGDVEALRYEVLGIDGRTAMNLAANRTRNQTIDIENLANGQYLLRITTTNGEVGIVRFSKTN